MNGKKDYIGLLMKHRTAAMGVAALWIWVFHEWSYLFAEVPRLGFVEEFLKRTGFMGVDIFFFLSGIGLTFALKPGKAGIRRFYLRRCKRIIPQYAVVGAIEGLLAGWTFRTYVANITGYSFWTDSIHAYLWFVPAIVTLYLLFPLYYRLFAKSRDKLWFTGLTISILVVIGIACRDTLRIDLYTFFERIPVFLIGVVIGWLAQNATITVTKEKKLALVLTFVFGIYLTYETIFRDYYLIFPDSKHFIPSLCMAVSISFLTAIVLEKMLGSSALHVLGSGIRKILVFYGTISFEFYLVQGWQLLNPLKDRFAGIASATLAQNLFDFALCSLAGWIVHIAFQYIWKIIEHKKTAAT